LKGAPARLEIIRADITALEVDAVVNAANARLIPGGGVDGAINTAAGPELAKAMAAIGSCPAGAAVITPGFKLKARHVIHAVAPVYSQHPEKDVWRLLANCYRSSLALAQKHNVQRIAFPSLGTGAYGLPIAKACRVAIEEVSMHLAKASVPHTIVFCCFSDSDAAVYRTELERRNG
jgi:O-acetyl-ADP-ribose deacetylase (regulator of RNase III)